MDISIDEAIRYMQMMEVSGENNMSDGEKMKSKEIGMEKKNLGRANGKS